MSFIVGRFGINGFNGKIGNELGALYLVLSVVDGFARDECLFVDVWL